MRKMKRKIIGYLTNGLLIVSVVTSPFISVDNVSLYEVCLWSLVLILVMIGRIYMLRPEKKKANRTFKNYDLLKERRYEKAIYNH